MMVLRMLVVVVAAAGAGCASDTSSIAEPTPTQNTGLLAIFAPKPKPELTLKEGQKLMADIQKNPKRAEKLTPQEKRFLAKAFAAKQQAKDDEAAGR